MHRDAAAAGAQHGGDVFLVIEQECAGRRAEERLNARDARHALQLGQRADIGRRGADVEGVIAMHAFARPRELVVHRGTCRGRRIGVGHLEDAGDPAQHGGAAAAFQVFLVLVAGLAEMALAVDDAGQDVQPLGVEGLGRLGAAQRPDGGDLAGAHADIAWRDAVRGGDGSAADQKIEGLGHAKCLRCGPSLGNRARRHYFLCHAHRPS